MRTKIITSILFFICISTSVHSQNTELDSLKTLYREASSDSIRMKLSVEIGINYNDINLDSSRKYQDIGFNLAKKSNNDENLAEAYKNLARIEYLSGKYDSSLAIGFRAIKIYEELGDEMNVAYVYTETLGPLYSQLGEYNKSIVYFKKALSIYESPGENMTSDQKLSKAAVLMNIVSPYYMNENIDSAILSIKAGALLLEELSKDTVENMDLISRRAIALNNLGFLLSINEEYNDALVYLLQSNELIKENGLDYILRRNLNSLADV